MTDTLPILYSFRRCPYAMRARYAIAYAQVAYEHREIALKDKPAAMLQASPKGTVPVLVLDHGQVIDESLDIVKWALEQADPDRYALKDSLLGAQARALIEVNDGTFKQALDKYKYAVRFPEGTQAQYRQQGEVFLQQLESQLSQHDFLLADCPNIADISIFPFIRQFSRVDLAWFEQAPYPQLRRWLDHFLGTAIFAQIMQKYSLWQA